MPIELKRRSVPVTRHSGELERSPPSVGSLGMAVAALFAVLHLLGGVMLAGSHAAPTIEPAAFVVPGNAEKCAAEGSGPEPSLPNVWNLASD
jgi:hypothetical protein